jgi:hypothetical protein
MESAAGHASPQQTMKSKIENLQDRPAMHPPTDQAISEIDCE